MPKINSNQRREPAFYTQLIYILIDCANKNMTYRATATELTAQGLLSPTGLVFTEDSIKQVMKKLRNYRTQKSFIAQALMELVFQGALTLKETLVLFTKKRDL